MIFSAFIDAENRCGVMEQRILWKSLIKKNAINISFLIISVIRWSFFMIKVSNERAENEFFSNLIIFYKFEHRWPNEFLTSQLHIVVNHSCVTYVSYEWYHRKEETLSFTDMCHLWIIIVVKIWLYIDQSRFRLFWDTLYNNRH